MVVGAARGSQVVRRQPGSSCDAGEHAWSDLIAIVKSENEVGPIWTCEDLVGAARLPLDRPADSQKCGPH